MKVCDLNKVGKILELFSVAADRRDAAWKSDFFANVVDASFACGDPQVISGPDGFPYFQLFCPEPYKSFDSFCICNLLEYTTENGFGIVINPRENNVDWVFSCGDLLSYRLLNSFNVGEIQQGHTQTTIQTATKVLVGAPAETILPKYTRHLLKNFMEQKLGLANAGVFLMDNPTASPSRSLVFSIFKEDLETEAQFAVAMNHLSWFLPRHLPPTSISKSENLISQFYPL